MDMDANSLIAIGARFATIESNLQNAIVGFDARLKRLEERYKQEETNKTQAERKKFRELQAELKQLKESSSTDTKPDNVTEMTMDGQSE